MPPQRYWEVIGQIVEEIESDQLDVYDCFDMNGEAYLTPLVREAINIRGKCFTEKDEDNFRAVVATSGVYGRHGLSDDERMALLLVGVDVKHQVEPQRCQRVCEPYRKDSPVFRNAPALWSLVREDLILVDSGEVSPSGQLLRFPSFLCRLHGHTLQHYALYENLYNTIAGNKLFLRIDQFDASQSDLIYVCEEAIRPIDPNFLKKMEIYKGEKKWGYYEVLPPEKVTDRQFLDYSRGFGRLEVVFKRNGNDLSCMIEELPSKVDGRVLTGLCLHATSKCPVGVSWNEAVADHIDGAINYYFDERALERFDSDISVTGCAASCRTHLFRIEETPLANMLPIAKLFFEAQSLQQDWINDQFRFIKVTDFKSSIS
ncbi:hypothetical protein [Oleidesulfovibrio alaskensis]